MRAQDAAVGIVVLTMYSGDEHLLGALEAGASAFVNKEAPSDDVVAAARHAVASPRAFAAEDLAGAMQRRMSAPKGPSLSPRESEVLHLLADGLSASQIGRRLYISESTIKTHIGKIYDKLGRHQPGPGRHDRRARRAGADRRPRARPEHRPNGRSRVGPYRRSRRGRAAAMLLVCGTQGGAAVRPPAERTPNMLARIRKVMDTADNGASAVEYGLLVAAIAAVVVVIVFALGGVVKEVFADTCDVDQDRRRQRRRQLLPDRSSSGGRCRLRTRHSAT